MSFDKFIVELRELSNLIMYSGICKEKASHTKEDINNNIRHWECYKRSYSFCLGFIGGHFFWFSDAWRSAACGVEGVLRVVWDVGNGAVGGVGGDVGSGVGSGIGSGVESSVVVVYEVM